MFFSQCKIRYPDDGDNSYQQMAKNFFFRRSNTKLSSIAKWATSRFIFDTIKGRVIIFFLSDLIEIGVTDNVISNIKRPTQVARFLLSRTFY